MFSVDFFYLAYYETGLLFCLYVDSTIDIKYSFPFTVVRGFPISTTISYGGRHKYDTQYHDG